MSRQLATVLPVAACMVLSGGAPAVGQGATPEPRYWIKPSEVAIPPDVPIGMYRRLIRPFENWTLICDENLKSKQRICNVSQLVVDKAGNTVFSWSLAATAQGKPVMILRVPPAAVKCSIIRLSFSDRKEPVEVRVESCDSVVCLGTVPVGPILRSHIARQSTVRLSYGADQGDVSFNLPFQGLPQALEAIE
ncbi:invasion associated locus B family protein [Sinorhizobium medicae]|nr:invasion associated locus B family protein [Sinorhizobium medicae]